MKKMIIKNMMAAASVALVMGGSLTACVDLDLSPNNAPSEGNVWNSASMAEQTIAGVYNRLYEDYTADPNKGWFDMWSSIMDIDANWTAGYHFLHANNTPTSDFGSERWWKNYYSGILRANDVITNLPTVAGISEAKKSRYVSECKFLRSWWYYRLNILYGGVPYYTEPVKSIDGAKKARSTQDEIWDYLIQDLTSCIDDPNLPNKYGADSEDYGHVTKGAAYALKSRAMLYAKRWQDAYDAANNVIALKLYGLTDKYEDAWKGNNKEAILEFDYDAANGPNHLFDRYYVPQCDGYDNGSTGTPTQEMVECYESKNGEKIDWTPWHGITDETPPYDQLEPRFAATVIYRGCTWKGKKMDCSLDGKNGVFMPYREQGTSYGKTTTGYFLRKLLDETLTDVKNGKSAQPWVEIRYAEVLLNKAEAAYRLNKIGEAQSAMNEVRARVKVNLPGKFSTGEAWFKDYRNERKVELAYEGHLFWDMRRWELAHIEYNNYRTHGFKIIGATNTYEYVDCDGQDRKFIKKLYVLPVPSEELKNNSLIEQYDEWK